MEIEERVTAGNKVSPVATMYHDVMRFAVWPREPHGWIFLGNVIDQLGKVMFADWKPYSSYGLLPDVAVGTTYQGVFIEPDDQLRYAAWLLHGRQDDADYIYRTNKPFAYLDFGDDGRSMTDDEWSTACDMSQQEWVIGLGNQRMFREVQGRIVEEAEAGRIVIGARPLRGGEPMPTPRDWWFTDHYGSRFSRLTIDPDNPFSDQEPSPGAAQHLFLRSSDLDCLLLRDHGEAVAGNFDDLVMDPEEASDRTGAPGRPSPMHLIEQDLRRRAAGGEMLPFLGVEAAELLRRYNSEPRYALLARTTVGTIENRLRDIYRELRQTVGHEKN